MMSLFDFVISSIEVVFFAWFLNKLLHRKPINNVFYYVFIAGIIFLTWGLTAIEFNMYFKPILLYLVQFSFVFIFFKDNFIKKLCMTVIFEAILLTCDFISAAILVGFFSGTFEEVTSNNTYVIFGSIISKIVLFMVMLLLNMTKSDRFESVPQKFWFAFLFFPVISVFIVLLLVENEIVLGRNNLSLTPYTTIVSIGVLVMNLLMIFLMEKLAQSIHNNSILNIEKQRLSYQQDYYDLLFAKQQEIRTLWHDLKHHFIVISLFAKENQNEKIIDYLAEIDEDIVQADNVVKTGNFVIDSIINQKYQIALNNNINISVKAALSQKLNIDSNDLCIIIANALDNSIEAVKNLKSDNPEDNIIKVNMDTKNDNFIFTVINQFNEIKLGKDDMPITTKKDNISHGLGLKSIEKTAQNYKGHMDIEIENKTFTLSVIMKI